MKLVLATRNEAKLAELRRILDPLVAVEVVGLADVPAYQEVPETGATFEENALIKAREAAVRTGLPAVADDSGLTVDALNGMPGVLSARWAGRAASDENNLRLVLEQTEDVPDGRRGGPRSPRAGRGRQRGRRRRGAVLARSVPRGGTSHSASFEARQAAPVRTPQGL